MFERICKNLSLFIGWLSIGMLFAIITYASSIEIKDLDLWLHLRMGYWIVHHGFVPNYDVLSCSIAGKPWVNHEWLFQVLVYQVQHAFGFNGLINMQSFVVAMTFVLLLFLGYSRDRQWLAVFTLLMVVLVYQTRFTIRPDIFSLLFFVIDIYILSLHINKRWALYALVIVQVLWSNMHGFFFFGPLIVGIAIFSEFIKRRLPLPYEWNAIGRLSDAEYKLLPKILFFLIVASCINPLTIKGAFYPLNVFIHLGGDNKIFFEHIVELQKPIIWSNLFTERYFHYKILIIMSAFSFVFNRRKIDISSLILWAIFLGFSLVAVRNLIYFAVAAYMVFMINIISISWEDLVPVRFTTDTFKYLTGIVWKSLFIFWMWIAIVQPMKNNGYFDFDTYSRKSEFFDVSKRAYPYKAVNFLLREKVKGNFFNDFNSGAYLVGRDNPSIKVFIDGRTEVYGANFFETYLKIWQEGNAKVFQTFERKDNITGAFLNNAHQQIPPAVLKMFYSFKNWSIVYLDDDAIIFLKQTPYNKPLIDRFAIDLNKWKTKPIDLFRVATRPIDPFPYTSRAYILETLGADQGALDEAQEALRISPDYGPAYAILGKIYSQRKDYHQAFEDYRIAAMYAQGDLPIRLGLAQAYENLKEYNGAVLQYQRVLDASPKNIPGYFGLARTYAENGQGAKALDMLAQAKKMGLEDKVDVQKIHDIINDQKLKKGPVKGLLQKRKVI